MKIKSIIAFMGGIILFAAGLVALIFTGNVASIIPVVIGASLSLIGFTGGRTALIIFGHTCIILGCFLVTWGIYLLPYTKPTLVHILTRPLFWGLFSIFGGICANYHGFCSCIRNNK